MKAKFEQASIDDSYIATVDQMTGIMFIIICKFICF